MPLLKQQQPQQPPNNNLKTKKQLRNKTKMASKTMTNYSDIVPTCTKFGEGKGIQFSDPTANQYGGKRIGMKYNNGRLLWKLPKMRAPFGIGQGMQGNGYNLQLSLDDDNDAAKELETIYKQIDENFKEYAINNAYELGITKKKGDKGAAKNAVDEKFKPLVKVATYSQNKAPSPDLVGEPNPDYPNYIQLAIPLSNKDGKTEVLTEFYDRDGKRIEINDPEDLMTVIPRQSRCTVLTTGSAWSGTPGFGISMRAQQVRVYANNESIPRGQCLIDDPEDEEEEEEDMNVSPAPAAHAAVAHAAPAAPATPAAVAHAPSPVQDEESEEEESEEEESEPEPEPEPVQPKRRITKKTVKK